MSVEPGLSFGRAVDAYERARPLYAADAILWLGERLPLRRVLDLGAGTGKLTRQLAATGADVVAVEPDPLMRAMLERVLPDVETHAGAAEAIPLLDESVDAITVGQAFHWFDLEPALHEMHRVLRPGGGFALLWNGSKWPALDAIIEPLRPQSDDDDELAQLRASPLFANVEERRFDHSEIVDGDKLVERVSSISAVINAEPSVREDTLGRVRELVGGNTVECPMYTLVIAGDRA